MRRDRVKTGDQFALLQGCFSALYEKSKRRWALSIVCTLLALFPVPLMVLTVDQSLRWCGVIIALALSVGGKWLEWWGIILGSEAEMIQRMGEYHRGLGRPIDSKKIADKRAKYRGLDKSADKSRIDSYYDYEGAVDAGMKGGGRLAEMFKESSWWTEHLAHETGKLLLAAIIVVILASGGLIVYSWVVSTSVSDGITGLVVCAILAVDLILLQRRYVSLEASSRETYYRLRSLLGGCRGTLDRGVVLIGIQDYVIARTAGPPIPRWIYSRHQAHLNRLWSSELSGDSDSM